MKPYLFPIFITSLGLFTAYIFYALWHSEEVNPPKIAKQEQKQIIEDLSHKEIIPRNTVIVPEASFDTHSQVSDEKEMQEMMKKQENIPNLSPAQMQAQTEAVYDSLTPEEHEETMQEANEAFEALDTYVAELDEKLAEQMQATEEVEESMDTQNDENIEEEQVYEPMEMPENEIGINMEHEDVNNP